MDIDTRTPAEAGGLLDRLRALGNGSKLGLVAAVAAAAAAAMFSMPPKAQDPAYHLFADSSVCLGIDTGIRHFGNMVSNLAFALVGLFGIAFTLGPRGRALFGRGRESWPYLTFFAAVFLISLGSAYYHHAPDNATLVWDRLPMAVTFMSLLAAFLVDRVRPSPNPARALIPLVLFGAGSVIYWAVADDLRFYWLAEGAPILLIPILCLLHPGRITRFRYAGHMLLWFGLATLCEHFDGEIHTLLNGALSGHTIKHLLAALATAAVLVMLRAAARRQTE